MQCELVQPSTYYFPPDTHETHIQSQSVFVDSFSAGLHPPQHSPQLSLSSLSAFLEGIKAINKAWVSGFYLHVTA